MVDYQGNLIDAEGIKNLPETTYALFRKGTIPNFAGPPISRDELADRIKNSTLPNAQVEIMEFKIDINDNYIKKILNIKDSGEILRMRI